MSETNKNIEGSLSVAKNVSIGNKAKVRGDLEVGHVLKVSGWLDAPNIRACNKGVYMTFDDLLEAYPNPKDGWCAGVGKNDADEPLLLYVAKDGEWMATGGVMKFDGVSAYEIAVQGGFEGTIEEWLASLKPSITAENVGKVTYIKVDGAIVAEIPDALDAYEMSVKYGYTTLSREEWLEKINGNTPVAVMVNNITLKPSRPSLEVGGTMTLTPTVSPENATDKTVVWSSSNEPVATVENGEVRGISEGFATIVCQAHDGSGVEATYKVQVSASVIKVTGVTLNKTSESLTAGDTIQLTATVTPGDATNKNVTWYSSNPSVAAVDANGKVTCKASGKATITVTTADGGKTAQCELTVAAKTIKVTGIEISPASSGVQVGGKVTLTAIITPADATDKTVLWSSNDETVATVADGVVTGVAKGTATIKCAAQDGSGVSGTHTVTVNEPLYAYYGTSENEPTSVSKNNKQSLSVPSTQNTISIQITTTTADRKKSHWIAVPKGKGWILGSVVDLDNDSVDYAQKEIDGMIVYHATSGGFISNTYTFTLKRE